MSKPSFTPITEATVNFPTFVTGSEKSAFAQTGVNANIPSSSNPNLVYNMNGHVNRYQSFQCKYGQNGWRVGIGVKFRF